MTRSIRILVLLGRAVILCPRTFQGPVTPKEEGQGIGACFLSSEDAAVGLALPAGGGEVHGGCPSQ